jgi:ankyrin repeat protein
MRAKNRCVLAGVFILLAVVVSVSSLSAGQVDRRLVEAIKATDFETAAHLIGQGVDVNAPQPDGATALHWAAHWDAVETSELLIGAGADVNVANDYGVTPIALACDNGADTMVRALLNAGADSNAARSTGETPVMTCARTGNADAVRLLLARGADPNASESWQGQTALMWAAGEGHVEIVRVLLSRGADVHARSNGGFTTLLIAARENLPELVTVLLEAGARVNDAASDGTTPLLVATVRGHAGLATWLLARGADPNADRLGYTALHWVAGSWHTELTGPNGIVTDSENAGEWRSLNNVRTGKLSLLGALLAHGANPNVRLEKNPPQFGFASGRFRVSLLGATPFLLAAMDGNVAAMRALFDAGANTAMDTHEHTTPLMVASGLGQVPAESRVTEGASLAAARFALDYGGDVNRTNDVGRTALHGAAHIRSDAMVQLLVDHGARLDTEDERGITPLMIAEGGGHILLPGLGGGPTADLLRALGSRETVPASFIDSFSQGAIR